MSNSGSRFRFIQFGLFAGLLAICLIQFLQNRAHVENSKRHIAHVLNRPIADVRIGEEKLVADEDAYQGSFEFTSNWFTQHIPIWTEVLEPYRGKPDVQYLEVGLYEGRSAIWALENILTHPDSRLTGVDVFAGDLQQRYLANLEKTGAQDRCVTIKGYSQSVLRELPLNTYDIIYIDGSHYESDVLEDAVLSWRLLKDNGVLIFDDYQWYRKSDDGQVTKLPRAAIDPFVRCFEDQCEVIHAGYQLILKKKPTESRLPANEFLSSR